jgi:hypothetical protein
VLGCVKHVLVDEVSAAGGGALVQPEPGGGASVRQSMAFDGNLKATNWQLGKLNVYLSRCGSLWILCHFLLFGQMVFFMFYIYVGLEYGERMLVPVYMPWSQTILNLYFGNTYVIPLLIAINYGEYTDFLYGTMSAAIKAGEPVSTVNNAENSKMVWSLLYYQTVDMFLLLFVFAVLGWIPNTIADLILIKGFHLSATVANNYNLFVSIFVIWIVINKLLKPAAAWYNKFTEGRNGSSSDANLAKEKGVEGHPSFDFL